MPLATHHRNQSPTPYCQRLAQQRVEARLEFLHNHASLKITKTRYGSAKLPCHNHKLRFTDFLLEIASYQQLHSTMFSLKTLMFSLLISAAAASPTVAESDGTLEKRVECGGGQYHTGPTPSGGSGCAWYSAGGVVTNDCCQATCICSYWGPVCKTEPGRCPK